MPSLPHAQTRTPALDLFRQHQEQRSSGAFKLWTKQLLHDGRLFRELKRVQAAERDGKADPSPTKVGS